MKALLIILMIILIIQNSKMRSQIDMIITNTTIMKNCKVSC